MLTIKKIKDYRILASTFIVIPEPLDDELFSSWFARTAYAHHTHPITFANINLNARYGHFFTKNVDVSINQDIINLLKYKSRCIVNINALLLKSMDGYLQENIIMNGNNKMITKIRFCPVCLREDIVKYFRKSWKIVFNTACTKHGCYLHDCCPKCKSEITLSKMYKNKLTFRYCSKCGFDLSKSRKLYISKEAEYGLTVIKHLNKILEQGYIQFNDRFVYSFYFFDVLMQLVKKIYLHRNDNFINKEYLFKYMTKNKRSKYDLVKFNFPIKEQYALFGLAFLLFEKYPRNLISYIKANKLSHWQVLKDMEHVSFWFQELITNITPRVIPISKIITKEEIQNGKKYLIKKNKVVNKANLSHLFGCSFFSSYNSLSTKVIY